MEEHEDEIPVWVKMVVTYETEDFPGIRQLSHLEFVDYAPHFTSSRELLESYQVFDHMEASIWHTEVPSPSYERPNHIGNLLLH